jgi:hypothetical protein
MINQNEFEERIAKYEFIPDIQECIDYKFPVVEYFVKYLANKGFIANINGNIQNYHTSEINLKKPNPTDDNNFTLLNYAFDMIRNKYKK